MVPMTPQAFEAAAAQVQLSSRMRDALRAHFVEGMPLTHAVAKFRVSQSGFYVAAARLRPVVSQVPEKRLYFVVPEHRADQLRTLVTRQLAIWAESDAAQ